MISKLITRFCENPKVLFLIDSTGAFLTAFFLFIVMRSFNAYFGMPETELTYLSAIAICFCVYSAACFFFLKGRWTTFFAIIGMANVLYCVFTTGLLIAYHPVLTIIGKTYFLSEIAIILGLSYVELSVAKAMKGKRMMK